MILAYLDESEARHAHTYFVGALVCTPPVASAVVEALDAVGDRTSVRFPEIPRDAELHGYAIANGTEDWAPMERMLRARLSVLSESIHAIALHDVRFLVRGVDTQALAARRYADPFPPHEVCLTHLLQRLEAEAQRADDYVLVIADEHHLANSLRKKLRQWKSEGTPGTYKKTYLSRVLDTIHFSPSSQSRLLQAADLLTYFHQRHLTHMPTNRDEIAYMAEHGQVVESIKHSHCGIWVP